MLATGTSRAPQRRPIGRLALALLGIGSLLVAAVFTAGAAAYAWPNDPWPPTETTIVGQIDDLEPGSVTPLWSLDIAGYLVRLEDGEFLAFDRAEPAIGCTLVWGRPGSLGFRDPCHGFEYDITGQPSADNRIRLPMNPFEVDIDRQGTIRVTTLRTPE